MGKNARTRRSLAGLVVAFAAAFCIAGGLALTAFAQPQSADGQDMAAGSAQMVVQADAASNNQYMNSEGSSTYTVTLPDVANAFASGVTTQAVEQGQAMAEVTYTADSGYYFEKFDDISSNGVTATWVSDVEVTVSGTPTGNVSIEIPSAELDNAVPYCYYTPIVGPTPPTELNTDGRCRDYTIVTENTTVLENGKWYVVDKDVTVDYRISVVGEANLILCDGVTLTAEKGIQVTTDNTLNIYTQSIGVSSRGVLVAGGLTEGCEIDCAGIGADGSNDDAGTVVVHGGTVTATGGKDAAGIGGGGDSGDGGVVYIYSGTVNATGSSDFNEDGSNVFYYASAGIGGGDGGDGGEVYIYGGTVNATGGSVEVAGGGFTGGAGIGGGDSGAGGSVFIYGGAVNAVGGKGAMAIGAGNKCDKESKYDILIIASDVTVYGGDSPNPQGQITPVSGEIVERSMYMTAEAPVNKITLDKEISYAESYYSEIANDSDYEDIAKELNKAIVHATGVNDSASATQDDVDNEVDAIAKALQKAKDDVRKADQAVADARKQIGDLPAPDDVTADDWYAIKEARVAYKALNDRQKETVGEDLLKKLEAAEKALLDAEMAKDAMDLIENLPDPSKVTTANREDIENARSAYDSLTPGQKKRVDPEALKKLEAAEEALEAAKTPIGDAAIAKIEDQVYTAAPVEPALKVTLDGKQLVAGTDYDVAYKDNVEVGEAIATVTGKGDYKGTATAKFQITGPAKKEAATEMADLDAGAWYLGGGDDGDGGYFPGTKTLYLDYTLARGLMSGYKNDKGEVTGFGPDDDLSRADAAVIIYRMANPGKTDTESDAAAKGVMNRSGMTDVQDERYYTAAVNWAVENNVITGYKDAAGNPLHLFGPDDPISREQLATIIGRYMDPEEAAGEDVSGFDDRGSISPYAHHGVAYCNANGVMTGIGGTKTFAPQATSTRCQMAKVIAVTDRLRAAS